MWLWDFIWEKHLETKFYYYVIIWCIRDIGIAGLNLKFNKKVKTNVERESIFIIKSHQTGPQFQKNYLQWWQTAKSYIGSTTKQSRIRFFQHLGKSPRTNRPVTVPAHSTPRNHCHENDHLLSLNDFKIIDSANNEHELRILESFIFAKKSPPLILIRVLLPCLCFNF